MVIPTSFFHFTKCFFPYCYLPSYINKIIPAEPGQVTGLVCSSSGGSVLSFNWTPPSLNADNVIDYVVEVTEYVQPESAVKQVIIRSLTSPFTKNVKSGSPASMRAVIDSGVGECTVPLTLIHCNDVFL